MSHETMKALFSQAVSQVASDISLYAVNPGKDFTRTKKLDPTTLFSFLVSCGSSSTRAELLDFFGLSTNTPSASAFNQQRAKLKPKALEAVFHRFNSSVLSSGNSSPYRFLAADGSTFTFFSRPSFSSPEYFVSEGHSAKGFYSMHLNAFYDLQKYTDTDALIQPVHLKDEFRAFCDMVDRHDTQPGIKDVFIGDRGILLDMALAENAIALNEISKDKLSDAMKDLTELENPNSVAQMKQWLSGQSVEAESTWEEGCGEDDRG